MFLYHKAVNVRSENSGYTSSLCITHDSKLASRDFANIIVVHTQDRGEAGGATIHPSDATVPRVSCRNRGAEVSLKGSQSCHKECKGMDQIRRTGKDDKQN